ncbi:MAG: GIY-YIG nuclease family protein [Deltaproteobacteria bacterium]|nr:GIY-YIG nuclease family protein [Deltaproteobacteria bacterium]
MAYFLYILMSEKDGTNYVGHTQDLTDRLERHKQGRVKYSKQNPPHPPFTKGGLKMGFLTGKRLSSPFSKGDRGGFYCAVVFPKTTAAY